LAIADFLASALEKILCPRLWAYRLSPIIWLAREFSGCGTLSRRQRCRL